MSGNRITKIKHAFVRINSKLAKFYRDVPSPAIFLGILGLKIKMAASRFAGPKIGKPYKDRVELSIDPNYVSWDLWACCRELLQNAKDADDLGYKMNVVRDETSNELKISNHGSRLERKTLVLGATSKRGTELRGKFGEGYKLAFAALLRTGRKIVVNNWDEVWIPLIEWSETFKTYVLVINIYPALDPKPELSITISDVSAYDFADISRKLLFGKEQEFKKSTTGAGILLKDKDYIGKLFVKGIFVNQLPGNFRYGYDLLKLELNRDRTLADPWSLKDQIHLVLNEAVAHNLIDPNDLYSVIDTGFHEALAVADSYSITSLVPKEMVRIFTERHGEDAIPVCNNTDTAAAHMMGRDPIFVSPQMAQILSKGGLSFDKLKRTKSTEFAKEWASSELTTKELNNLNFAIDAVRFAEKLDKVHVVNYYGDMIGLYDGGKISVARSILENRAQTVATLVHEVGHRYGGDGTSEHRWACERIFSKIICVLDGKAA